MYSALWRVLPGNIWIKIAILTVAAAAVISVLMIFVFPVVDTAITVRDVTVNQ
jgi:hypothetical protein